METYEGDYYGWLNATAQAIEEKRFDQIDVAQVAEELRDMGKSEKRSIESLFERLLLHLLKIQYQAVRHTRSWDFSIADSRLRLTKLFRENPSLASQSCSLMVEAYEAARLAAADESGIALDVFPEQCPFTLADAMERDWSGPESAYERLSRLTKKL